VFTAHSIPTAMAGAARYVSQLRESAALVAARVNHTDWSLVFQSRSGRPEDPWLEPDICQYLRAEREKGLPAAVLCPIGFLCDHIEVLYDLDHEAREVAMAIGLPIARAEAVNDDPRFLDTMARAVAATWNRYRAGTPLSIGFPLPVPPREAGGRPGSRP
jgi:ferrochelatase